LERGNNLVTKKNNKQPSGRSLGGETMNKGLYGSRLQEALEAGMTDEQFFAQLFNKKIWTMHEFACLMAGITPQEYQKLLELDSSQITQEQIKRVNRVHKTNRRLITYTKRAQKVPLDEWIFIERNPCMSPWKFIKWIAMNGLPITKGFAMRLPLNLLEIYLYFLPNNNPLRTRPRDCREVHRALYLEYAKELQKEYSRRLTYEEIYANPRMLHLLRSFKKRDGSPANYKKRTVTDSWLPTLEKRPRGRPKKI
jgi:hypothetical protein